MSPRTSSGDWEPQYDSRYRVYLDGNSSVYNNYIVASGTCFGCRQWPGGTLNSYTTSQPMMYALGPPYTPLRDNDLGATIKRHTAYGRFLLSTVQASGYGGTGVLTSIDNNANLGTQAVNTYGANSPGGVVVGDAYGLGLAHGIVLAIVALVLAPIDLILGSGRLLASFPLLHALVSVLYLLMLVAGFGIGIRASGEYVVSQHFATGHQIIGFIAFFVAVLLLGLGIALHVGRAMSSADGRGRGALAGLHMWGMRLLWVLILIDGGL